MDYKFRDYCFTYRSVDFVDYGGAVERQLVFQRGRRNVNMQHSPLDIATGGVAVDRRTDNLDPHVAGLLTEKIVVGVALEQHRIDDFVYLLWIDSLHFNSLNH